MRWIWLVPMVVACGGGSGEGTRSDAILALTGDATAGETVYTNNCAVCHAASGLGVDDGGSGTNLTETAGETDDTESIDYILNGEGNMPAFSDLSDQEIADVLAYIHDGLIQ
jgi:mono/diheme cytochrome c family protein